MTTPAAIACSRGRPADQCPLWAALCDAVLIYAAEPTPWNRDAAHRAFHTFLRGPDHE